MAACVKTLRFKQTAIDKLVAEVERLTVATHQGEARRTASGGFIADREAHGKAYGYARADSEDESIGDASDASDFSHESEDDATSKAMGDAKGGAMGEEG